MKRWILIGGGLIVLIAIVVLYFVFSSLDSLIIAAVEKFGSQITQTEVRLKEAKVSVTSGEGVLRGLSMGNPKGFKTENALRLGEISLKLDVGTVTKDPVVIREIAISAPQVTYELGPNGSNIDAIKRNINAYVGKGKDKPKENGTAKNGEKKEGRKLVIEHLYIRNGKISIGSTLMQGKTLSAPLPDIHLTDIGKKKGGATAGEVAEKVFDAISKGVGSAVAKVDPRKMLGAAKEGIAEFEGSIKERAKGAADSVKRLLGN
jgi:hypothetical protein